jgi:hypothetical protein
LTKTRLISVLLIASLFAYMLSFFGALHLVGINGMCDGGGLL